MVWRIAGMRRLIYIPSLACSFAFQMPILFSVQYKSSEKTHDSFGIPGYACIGMYIRFNVNVKLNVR